jgi:hypothetical protein
MRPHGPALSPWRCGSASDRGHQVRGTERTTADTPRSTARRPLRVASHRSGPRPVAHRGKTAGRDATPAHTPTLDPAPRKEVALATIGKRHLDRDHIVHEGQ